MSKVSLSRLLLAAATILTPHTVLGQVELQVRARQLPGWDARSREGRCEIRVWVDQRAEVRLRGDTVFVRTVEGAKGRDEGSECSQPLPFNSVSGFQIRQSAGRNRVELAQEPGRMNNYTALVAIEDRQGGGDNYAFEVSWNAGPNVGAAPAPFFDDVRACQDAVRQRFQNQNGRGAYLDFQGFADRARQDVSQGHRDSRNHGEESIRGRGNARSESESRDLTYSCVVDTRQNQVMSVEYRYHGDGLHANNSSNNHRQLR